jgi:ribose transport system ATP-binding protein
METSPLVLLENVTKWFGANRALDGASFTLYPGEVHALVGVNGAGKSTLMKIMAGVHMRDSGRFFLRQKEVEFSTPQDAETHGIAIVYQELSLLNDLTVAENILIRHLPARGWIGRIDRAKSRALSAASLSRLGIDIDPDTMVGDLPVGQKQLVEIAKALSTEAAVVIFDEPTSALTDTETHALFRAIRQLKADGVGVIYISHHLDELFQVADRLTVLRDGRSVATRSVEEVDISRVVELMLGKANALPKRESHARETQPLLRADSISTEELRGPVTLELRPGEIVALAGQLGSGRTELLRALYGVDRLVGGIVTFEGERLSSGHRERIRAGVGFVPEERKVEGVISGASIGDNVVVGCLDQLSVGIHMQSRKERKRAEAAVNRVGVVPPDPSPPIEALSGGNQQKAIIGRWIAREGVRVLLLDEPTRGIDVGAKTQIYRLLDELAKRGVAILFSSSDEEEILGVADRIVIMRRGAVAKTAATSGLDVHELTTLIVGGEI